MKVIPRFERYVEDNKLFFKSDKLLVAVSGGKDSMLLIWLLLMAGYSVEIAHCNFQLRGEESDKDEALVRDFADEFGILLHVERFDTVAYSEENKTSIQIAARELRYTWFAEKATEVGAKYIAIAQHKNDHVETVLLNMTRGTGLLGLQGILNKRTENNIVRPLLFLDSREISELVSENNIPYRDDASNFSTKYVRNKIRLDIIPEFEKLNTDFITTMNDNIGRFQEANQLLKEFVDELRGRVFKQIDTEKWSIAKRDIMSYDITKLYYLFEPFGFVKSVLQDMKSSISKESGRIFEATSYVMLLDREMVILSKKEAVLEDQIILEGDVVSVWGAFSFHISEIADSLILKDPNVALLNHEKIVFPLRIRKWEEGDTFQPLGMKGKKKISDLFIQKKINLMDKKKIPLLINGNGDVVWVVGIQLDDRYKITENTQKVLKLAVSK